MDGKAQCLVLTLALDLDLESLRYSKLGIPLKYYASLGTYGAGAVSLVIFILLYQLARRRKHRAEAVLQQIAALNNQIVTYKQDIDALQNQLKVASRLATLGEMSSEIAHEVNNPLTIIYGRVLQMKALLTHSSVDIAKIGLLLDKIDANIKRVIQIIAGLRTLGRDGSQDLKEEISIAKIIDETVDLCITRFSSLGVQLKLPKLETSEIRVRCRAVQISQVLTNLLVNAVDEVCKSSLQWVEIGVEDGSDSVRIKVTDSGPGIAMEVRANIFKPFFTTKPANQGTGLGLSISREIIEDHGGRLYLDPNVPNTCFVIELPKTVQVTK
jgi:C4-dicarboxylate-specific signal transduction histidine kinase